MSPAITPAAVTLTALAVLAAACGGPQRPLAPLDAPARPPASTSGQPSGQPPEQSTAPPTARPVTAADRALVTAFLRFARDPGTGTAGRVGFAATVRLGLGDDARRVVRRRALADRATWQFRIDPRTGWRGRDGTVDVLALARTAASGHDVTVGPHPHCASPPVPTPGQAAGLRHVAVQPRLDAGRSCIDWWTVDLFVDSAGQVRVVTVDAWDP